RDRHLGFVPVLELESKDRSGVFVDVLRDRELDRVGAEPFGPPVVGQNTVIGYTRHGWHLLEYDTPLSWSGTRRSRPLASTSGIVLNFFHTPSLSKSRRTSRFD